MKENMNEWNLLQFAAIVAGMEDMTAAMDNFALRCKKMPGRLRAFDAYKNLNKRIEDFQIVLPLLQELAKPSVMVRHWDELRVLVKNDFDQESADFTLEFIISLKLENVADEVLEITDGAGCKAVIDGIGKATLDMSLGSLAQRGIFVSFGNASGAVPAYPPLRHIAKSSFMCRPKLLDYTRNREELLYRSNEIMGWLQSGQLKVSVDTSFPLDQAAEGHKYLESGASTGKVLYRID